MLLAALSSFYAYALNQDLLRGVNPFRQVERRKTQRYAGAVPLPYAYIDERLRAIERSTRAGKRDYALITLGLNTGRRLSELAGLRWGHITTLASRIEIVWARAKGGKVMMDVLPLRGPDRAVALALSLARGHRKAHQQSAAGLWAGALSLPWGSRAGALGRLGRDSEQPAPDGSAVGKSPIVALPRRVRAIRRTS